MKHPVDKRYDEVATTAKASAARMGRGEALGEREQVQVTCFTYMSIHEKMLLMVKGTEEAERLENSTALKDRFKYFMAGGVIFPQTSNKNVIRAAREGALELYDKMLAACEERIALKEERERLAAQHQRLSDEQAARLAALEKQTAEISATVAGGTLQPITIGKPLKLKMP